MLHPLVILAQQTSDGAAAESGASEGSVSIFDRLIILFRPEELLDQLSRIPLILAAVVVTLGILSIFNGYRWHKWLVAVLAFVIGLGLGWHFSQEMGRSVVVAAAVGGLFAIVATPLLRNRADWTEEFAAQAIQPEDLAETAVHVAKLPARIAVHEIVVAPVRT